MKIEKSKNQIIIEFKNGLMIDLWQCITEIFTWRKYNWNTWQLINIEIENDTWLGGLEFTFVLLCCGIRIRIPIENPKSKKNWNEINKSMKKINESCYGWIGNKEYKEFKTKKANYLLVKSKREKGKRKKIFIQ